MWTYPFRKEYPVTLKFWAEYPKHIQDVVGFKYHRGIDFGTPKGIDVRAVEQGKIIWSGNDRGLGVVVEYGQHTWRYWHLSKIIIKSGFVSSGDIIGITGNTGLAYGSHTHIELQETNYWVDWLERYYNMGNDPWVDDVCRKAKATLIKLKKTAWVNLPCSEQLKIIIDEYARLEVENKALKKQINTTDKQTWIRLGKKSGMF